MVFMAKRAWTHPESNDSGVAQILAAGMTQGRETGQLAGRDFIVVIHNDVISSLT